MLSCKKCGSTEIIPGQDDHLFTLNWWQTAVVSSVVTISAMVHLWCFTYHL